MPIYEFECSRCSCHFDLKRSFGEDTPAKCPECGAKAERIFVPVPIIFKGSGFYVTDNRGSSSTYLSDSNAEKSKDSSTDKPKTDSAEKAKTATQDKAGSKKD